MGSVAAVGWAAADSVAAVADSEGAGLAVAVGWVEGGSAAVGWAVADSEGAGLAVAVGWRRWTGRAGRRAWRGRRVHDARV